MPRSIITMNGQCSGTGRFLLPARAHLRSDSAPPRVKCRQQGPWRKGRPMVQSREARGQGRRGGEDGLRRRRKEKGAHAKASAARAACHGRGGGMDEPLVLMGWERRPDGRSGSGRIHGAKRHHRNTLARTIETRLQCHEESCYEGLVVRCSGSERGDQAGKASMSEMPGRPVQPAGVTVSIGKWGEGRS